MELTELIAAYLKGHGFHACCGFMPQSPDQCIAVYATGLRPRGDDEGSRFQIIVRSSPEADTALAEAAEISDTLDDFSGILTIDSPYFQRIMLETGIASLGADENGRVSYSINFRAWMC